MIGTGNDIHTEGRGKNRRFKIRPEYVILLLAMAFFTYKFLQKTQEVRGLAQQEAAMRYQNNQLAERNAAIRRQIQYYETSQYIEDTARGILGYTKPGETSIQSDPVFQAVPREGPGPARSQTPPVPPWKRWWHAFFG